MICKYQIICQIGIFLIVIVYCSWFRIFKENWDSFGMVLKTVWMSYYFSVLGIYYSIAAYTPSYTFLLWGTWVKFWGAFKFQKNCNLCSSKNFGGHLKWLLVYLLVWMAAFWKFLLSCIRKLSRTLFAKSNFPLSNEDNQKKLFIKGKESAMSAPKLELRVGPWRCVMWKVKWCSC